MSTNDDITYKSKNKKRRKRLKSQTYVNSLQADCDMFSYSMKAKPHKTMKNMVIRIGLYTWGIAVFFSILNLIGFPVASLFTRTPDGEDRSHSRVLRASDSEISSFSDSETTDFWSSISNNIFVISDLGGDSDIDVQIDEPVDPDEEEIEIPEQILPDAPKQGNKLNKQFERELSCQEEDCNSACNSKIKAKCSRSASCRKDRARLCKKRCRKQRCEDRCKDEPKFGYVEREQRMEKCKDECSGPTAAHNKCIKKCHSQFKPCKSRCQEIANKYSCNRVEVTADTISVLFEEDEEELI